METFTKTYNAEDYETRYKKGYGHAYPESHIIRIHRQILEWELNLSPGKIFDFGCGTGANLGYFLNQGYQPYGCDTSATAIEQCKKYMPSHANNFYNTEVSPNLVQLMGEESLTVFMSNQVLYFLSDEDIKKVVEQAYKMLKPGGVFIASMMSYACWYIRQVSGVVGDFKELKFTSPREKGITSMINFKHKDELPSLFSPFKKLHLGSYANHIREEEGPTEHWLFVGIKA